jgi:hypothetical protein
LHWGRLKILVITNASGAAKLMCQTLRTIFTFINVHLDIIKVFYPPTDAEMIFSKNNIKIYIKTALTFFSAVTPSPGSSLSVLAKVTLC